MNIGDSLAFLRTENQLTQEAFAQTINIARSTLSNYERNNRTPDIYTLVKIANYFNVTLDYFVGQSSNINESDRKSVFRYYDRLNAENKDCIKGFMIQLYRDESLKKNPKKTSG